MADMRDDLDPLLRRMERLTEKMTQRYERVPDEILEQRWRRREQIKDVLGAMAPFLIVALILAITSVILSLL